MVIIIDSGNYIRVRIANTTVCLVVHLTDGPRLVVIQYMYIQCLRIWNLSLG